MSEIDNDTQEVIQDELTALKQRADMLGVTYHPSIGVEKLRDKVNAALAPEVKPKAEEVQASSTEETESQKRSRMKREATRLVRIRVTCMNPAKKEWEGEFFSVGNSVVGSLTKYVPFNADEGWHVPHMIYQMIIDRQCQIFQTISDSRGNKTRQGKLIKEFAVEILPNLTAEEMHDLAQRQAMSKSID